ncbi:metallophosphoesterase [Phyllobacterium endophyticum]|uniref:Serine/threonine protein phosphatase n=1 Tax=Phyllobacterium endophyticum TaxID=1149773 RepID=A0A2P7B0F2_9HYPH|nr:metallophosphoesterase [Phyllobacterium endophyticum]MBB3235375.1 serine/threonine protein phosphatase 1 [Phyllobacterium endophyticum]PSH59950.1 serine/threonine protein phosphatase [Phyllobacterium endophyticum]TXR49999.1 serine/threonine protein phosphatase [Phyllobacterium endophyticum]TYR42115.1 serine/threonine protein phosphatase [Phyllobacterium endophyticum]
MKSLLGFLRSDRPVPRVARRRLSIDIAQSAVYVIGDVHGCYDQLLTLEGMIAEDAAALPGAKLIIMLGDYIDRGPSSAQVIDHLIHRPPAGFQRICLTGNHDMAMLDYLEKRLSLSEWWYMGANPTLLSYGIDLERLRMVHNSQQMLDDTIRSSIPQRHRQFLRSLPILADAGNFLFVHAGIRPSVPLKQQSDEDLVSIRSEFYDNAHLLRQWVVHGHTPIENPRQEGRRFNIDTGAFHTGKLSALRLWNKKGRVLST